MKRESIAKIGVGLILFASILSIYFAYFGARTIALDHLITANFLLIVGLAYLMGSELWKLGKSLEEIKKKLEEKTVQG